MRFTKAFTAAAVAVSMAGAPVLAQPSAAPLSISGSVRSGAPIDGAHASELQHPFITVAVILAVVLAAILIPEITKPNSP